MVISWQAPGFSYVFLIPTGAAALAGLPATLRRSEVFAGAAVAAVLPLAAVGVVAFAPALLLYSALGNPSLVLIALVVGLICTPLAPLCADLRDVPGLRGLAIPWIPILATALALFAAVVVPAYSAKAPERVNIEFSQDADTGNAQWIVEPNSGRLPEPIRLAATFRATDHGAFPWDTQAAFVSDAPHLDIAPPTFTILESSQAGGRRNYRTLLRSERGATYVGVFFPPGSGVEDVRLGGQPLPPATEGIRSIFNGWVAYDCPATPASGIEISFSVPLGKTVEVSAADENYGLPPEGAFLLNSRPLTATPSQNGDVTIVTRRVQLLP